MELPILSYMKSLSDLFSTFVNDLPEGLKVLTEFVWRLRWFLFATFVMVGVYHVVMVMLPFLLWSWVIKSSIGFLFSLFH